MCTAVHMCYPQKHDLGLGLWPCMAANAFAKACDVMLNTLNTHSVMLTIKVCPVPFAM